VSGLVFLGTPAGALPSLDAVHATGDLRLVITMPDRPRGRSRRPQPPPVKARAEELGVPVAQPASKAELEMVLGAVGGLELGVVVAYGMIISPAALEIPRLGLVNVHLSLLPRWRGAAPVERAILAGDTVTGVTLMQLDEGLDTGPVLARWRTSIGADESGGALTERLAVAGAELLAASLAAIRAGELVPEPQPETGATYARMISTGEAALDPSADAGELERGIRAFNPRPGAFFLRADERFKVHQSSIAQPPYPELAPGELQQTERDRLLMGTGSIPLDLIEVQAAGSRRMPGAAWARGQQGDLGSLA
jgi:methionyl-tRNA formyltransferase